MTAFPSAGAYTENGITQGTLRQRLDDQLAATRQLVGASAVQSLTLSSDAITPAAGASGSIKVDTQSAAATDDLKNISTSNLPDGSHVLIRITDNGRVVTVKHNAGGAGQISLSGGLAYEMNRVEQWLELRREGADWVEVRRGGREKEHVVGAAGEPAYANSFLDGSNSDGISFWKDESGQVHIHGSCEHASTTPLGTTIFTLPAGYRPSVVVYKPMIYVNVGAVTPTPAICVVNTNGTVWMDAVSVPYPQSAISAVCALHISDINFRAAA